MISLSTLNTRNVRNRTALILAAAALGAVATSASASMVVLQDNNSSVVMFTQTADGVGGGTLGVNQWIVSPGFSQLAQQWFWYRIGPTGGEQPINTLSDPVVQLFNVNPDDPANDTARLTYASDTLRATITYQLTGGTLSSGTSDLAEVIKLENLTNSTISLHFFQYSDFNLGNPQIPDDTTRILNGNTAIVSDPSILVSETVVTPKPSHEEVNLAPATLASLNDGLPTTLNDNPGPIIGDTTWAFQWDVDIAPRGSFIISKDKQLSPVVPEPTSLALLGVGAAAGLLRRRRA